LKYLSNKKGFLGIDNKVNIKEKVVVVPFGLEKTVSYGGGTSRGPAEIIKASHQVELYDEDLNKEKTIKIIDQILKGEKPKPGSYRGRTNSAPEKNRKTLMENKNA